MEAQKLIAVLGELLSLVGKAMEDGKVGAGDVSHLVAALPKFVEVAGVDFEAVLAEVKTLTPEQAQELADVFAKHFDIPQESLEAGIEVGLAHVKELMALVQLVIKFIKAVKK